MTVMTETIRIQPHPPYELAADQVRVIRGEFPRMALQDPDDIEAHLRCSLEADGDEAKPFWSRFHWLYLLLF